MLALDRDLIDASVGVVRGDDAALARLAQRIIPRWRLSPERREALGPRSKAEAMSAAVVLGLRAEGRTAKRVRVGTRWVEKPIALVPDLLINPSGEAWSEGDVIQLGSGWTERRLGVFCYRCERDVLTLADADLDGVTAQEFDDTYDAATADLRRLEHTAALLDELMGHVPPTVASAMHNVYETGKPATASESAALSRWRRVGWKRIPRDVMVRLLHETMVA